MKCSEEAGYAEERLATVVAVAADTRIDQADIGEVVEAMLMA